MQQIRIERFDENSGIPWNSFIETSNEGTLFHRLDFLAYHGERFKDKEHHLVFHKGNSIFGLMPMAIMDQGVRRVGKSPYGGSYGGPSFSNPLNYFDSKEAIEALVLYCSKLKLNEIEITLPIFPCYRYFSDTFRFVLMETGFQCVNRDISSVVCLDSNNSAHEQMHSRLSNIARKARKAEKQGIKGIHQPASNDLWEIMEATYLKHGTKPTHSREDLEWLMNKFPERIYADVAYLDDIPVAGLVLFVINTRVVCSFYLVQNPIFQKTQALSFLLYNALLRYQDEKFSWFDLGTSSVGMVSRPGVFRFKENFGALGAFRETYRLSLDTD